MNEEKSQSEKEIRTPTSECTENPDINDPSLLRYRECVISEVKEWKEYEGNLLKQLRALKYRQTAKSTNDIDDKDYLQHLSEEEKHLLMEVEEVKKTINEMTLSKNKLKEGISHIETSLRCHIGASKKINCLIKKYVNDKVRNELEEDKQ